jgi:hypothetical protein
MEASKTILIEDEAGLTLLGYIAFLDPPKRVPGGDRGAGAQGRLGQGPHRRQ